jgi:hypothetical protein
MKTYFRAALSILLAAPVFGADTLPSQGLVAHEWGTFTSVAGENGEAVNWQSLTGSTDLPCFVHRATTGGVIFKSTLMSLERMETPVVYFYTQRKAIVSLRADLPSGSITEWYPQASSTPNSGRGMGTIAWNLEVLPGSKLEFPMTDERDHYFAARDTDAAPVRAGNEAEKMLFYRGVAGFPTPLAARFGKDGGLKLTPRSGAIGFAMLFENRGGKIGYRILRDLQSEKNVDAPELSGDAAAVQRELKDALTSAGLYPKEAAAMLATWSDSWFEEGMRVIYLTPRSVVDSVLPLHIAPAPESVARVFVGRIELLPDYLKETLATAIAKTDKSVLDRFGRFYGPFSNMIRVPAPKETQDYMNAKFARALEPAKGCGGVAVKP